MKHDPSAAHRHGHSGHGGAHLHFHPTLRGRFAVSIALNACITLAELVGGILTNSLALISDALHNFSDVFSLVMSYLGERVKERPNTPKMTYGYRRLETLIALVNAVSLGAIAIFILLEALGRWKDPQPVEWKTVFVVGMIALTGNLISVVILRPEKDKNLNVKSAFLHLFFDAISSVGVMASAVIIAATGWYPADLAISLGISLMIVLGSFGLLKGIYNILMEGVPHGVDPEAIQHSLERLADIVGVHHLHVWSLSSDRMALSAHIVIEAECVKRLDQLLDRAAQTLREQYGFSHITLQPEIQHCADPEASSGQQACGDGRP